MSGTNQLSVFIDVLVGGYIEAVRRVADAIRLVFNPPPRDPDWHIAERIEALSCEYGDAPPPGLHETRPS